MLKTIFLSSRSVTLELVNQEIYYAKAPFDVLIDGKIGLKDVKTNVFSLFNLQPATQYKVSVLGFDLELVTWMETAELNVRDFGAAGDGMTDDTKAIQTAIFSCPVGGRILIPSGTYSVCPLFLKSHQTIELAKNAVLLGNVDRTKYPILPACIQKTDGSVFELSSWEGESKPTFASIITGIEVEDVKIIGQGIIDENAQNSDWWQFPKQAVGGGYRPKGVFLTHCDHIAFQGITITNTPSWNLHPYLSQHIDFIDLKIISPKDSPNTDGCDPESCDFVSIIGVDFSVGDDCIAIKSGKYEMGLKNRRACQNITIRNCHMAFGHGAVVLGSEMSGGIKNLSVSQCYFEKTDRGLRIKTRRGRGKIAVIDGVTFENIYMNEVLTPLVMNMFYYCDEDGKTEYVWSKEALPIDHRTPRLGSFTFKDIVCENVHVAAGFFYGLPEQPIEKISLENVSFSFAEKPVSGIPAMMSFLKPMVKSGLQFRNVGEINLKKVRICGQIGEPILLESVKTFINE